MSYIFTRTSSKLCFKAILGKDRKKEKQLELLLDQQTCFSHRTTMDRAKLVVSPCFKFITLCYANHLGPHAEQRAVKTGSPHWTAEERNLLRMFHSHGLFFFFSKSRNMAGHVMPLNALFQDTKSLKAFVMFTHADKWISDLLATPLSKQKHHLPELIRIRAISRGRRKSKMLFI